MWILSPWTQVRMPMRREDWRREVSFSCVAAQRSGPKPACADLEQPCSSERGSPRSLVTEDATSVYPQPEMGESQTGIPEGAWAGRIAPNRPFPHLQETGNGRLARAG